MDVAEASFITRSSFFSTHRRSLLVVSHRQFSSSTKNLYSRNLHLTSRAPAKCISLLVDRKLSISKTSRIEVFNGTHRFRLHLVKYGCKQETSELVQEPNIRIADVLVKRGIVLAAIFYGISVLRVLKEQDLVLAALLGLSAFFSLVETSITTSWPWKVRELAEKESKNGVFKLLRSDVTRFLTTILIATTALNIGATALVTKAATTIFGEAGVSAATGVMTVAVLLLTEITPKSIAVTIQQKLLVLWYPTVVFMLYKKAVLEVCILVELSVEGGTKA